MAASLFVCGTQARKQRNSESIVTFMYVACLCVWGGGGEWGFLSCICFHEGLRDDNADML